MISKEKERKNLLVFGYGLAAICAFIAVRLWMKHGFAMAPAVLLIAAVVLIFVSAMDINRLKPVYVVWMKVAHVIGGVVSTIIYGILFYAIFGVVGILMRLLGKDLLDEHADPAKTSYWVLREKKEFKQEHYQQQF